MSNKNTNVMNVNKNAQRPAQGLGRALVESGVIDTRPAQTVVEHPKTEVAATPSVPADSATPIAEPRRVNPPKANHVAIRLNIRPEVIEAYESQAAAQGKFVEDVLEERLASCVAYTADKPLYVTDEQRRRIEVALDKNIHTPEQLVDIVLKLVTLNVAGVDIPLSDYVMQRLETRTFGNSFEDTVREVVLQGIHGYTNVF